MNKLLNWVSKNYLILIFVISAAATFGSLYFSEVLNLAPCAYCWYQRIFMYPLFIISAVTLAFNQMISKKIIAALAIPGLLFAVYHFVIQTFPDPNRFVPCIGGIDCSKIDWTLQQLINIDVFKYVTLPFLSIIAFGSILVLLGIKYIYARK